MRTDYYIGVSALKTAQALLYLLWRAEAREHIHVYRKISKTAERRLVVLKRKDRGRHQNCDLLARQNRLVRGSERDLGLTVANVTAKQTVHRHGAHHILLDVGYRVKLTIGLGVVKRALKILLHSVVGVKGKAGAAHSLGVKLDQVLRHLAHRSLCLVGGSLPSLAAHS